MTERRGPEIPDGIELHKDGTATLSIDNHRIRLRRPKLGEMRKLRELLRERDDERLRLMAEETEPLEKPADDAEAADKLAYTQAVTDRGRRLNDGIEDLNVAWLEEALGMLSRDGAPPPADDWPSGMSDTETVQKLMDHWREVPLRSGGG